MKRYSIYSAILAAGCCIPASASAQTERPPVRVFGEAGYSRVELNGDPDVGFNALHARIGVQFHRYIGVEVEGGFGLGSETVNFGGFDVETELKSAIGAFAILSYPVSDNVEILGRAGYASVRISADAGFGPASASEDAFAGGVGLRLFPSGGDNGVRVDYTRYEFDDGGANAFQISYVRRF